LNREQFIKFLFFPVVHFRSPAKGKEYIYIYMEECLYLAQNGGLTVSFPFLFETE